MRVQIFLEQLFAQDIIISCDSTEIDKIIKSSDYVKSIVSHQNVFELKFYGYSRYPGVYDVRVIIPKASTKYVGTIFYENSTFFNMPIFQNYVKFSINYYTISKDPYSKYLNFFEEYSWRSGTRVLHLPYT